MVETLYVQPAYTKPYHMSDEEFEKYKNETVIAHGKKEMRSAIQRYIKEHKYKDMENEVFLFLNILLADEALLEKCAVVSDLSYRGNNFVVYPDKVVHATSFEDIQSLLKLYRYKAEQVFFYLENMTTEEEDRWSRV